MHQPGEPHVDVILDRIKQVIARDNRASDGRAPRTGLSPMPLRPAPMGEDEYQAALDPVDADEAAEVLDLGEDGIVPQSSHEHDGYVLDEPFADSDGDADLVAHDWAEPEGPGAAHALPEEREAPPSTGGAQDDAAPLVSERASAAARDQLAALSTLSALARERRARGLDDVSIETMAHDLLRPMLAEWLDKNLPATVERMVQAEIRRIVGEQG